MNERPEQDEYEEEEDLDSGEDVDQAMREEKHTAELTSDFDDYDIEPAPAAAKRTGKGASKR
jgi:hypothetical protein